MTLYTKIVNSSVLDIEDIINNNVNFIRVDVVLIYKGKAEDFDSSDIQTLLLNIFANGKA